MTEIVEIWKLIKRVGKVKNSNLTYQKVSELFHKFRTFYIPGMNHVYKIFRKDQ